MTSATETQIVEIIRSLPEPALEEIKNFLDFLAWRYQQKLQQNRGLELIAALKGKATNEMTTDQIMTLTRDNP